jgi:hypothetical protein
MVSGLFPNLPRQMDAILFWDRFEGRWLRGSEFHHPKRPKNLPSLKPLENWLNLKPRDVL